MGLLLGVIVAILVIVLFLVYQYQLTPVKSKSKFENEGQFVQLMTDDPSRQEQMDVMSKWGFDERNINYSDAKRRAEAGYLANEEAQYQPEAHHEREYKEQFTGPDAREESDYTESLLGTLDKRTFDSHREFVDNTAPYSSVPRNIDKFEPGDYVPFTGLRRPQGVPQSKYRLQVTELDGENFQDNKPFNFKG